MVVLVRMKSTKVQTLGAVALHVTTAYTDVASIIGKMADSSWLGLGILIKQF